MSADIAGRAFDRLWNELAPIGREATTGGYRRYAWTAADLACREWFTAAASDRGLDVETDRNGNLWAWWGDQAAGDALVMGSHLDSVPDGGAFDGPLGVVSAFAALEAARARGLEPHRPIAVAAFSDEEGARFGVACAGSRLLTGALTAGRARALRDGDVSTMADAMAAAGHDPAQLGPDPDRLARIGCFIELHVEQGRVRVDTDGGPAYGLADLAAPVGVASGIWPHGRWRFEFTGRADHAGTTRLDDRDDPMLPCAATVLAAREAALKHDALATVGKVRVEPNGVNAIPSRAIAWLDARGADERRVRALVADLVDALASIQEAGPARSAEAQTGAPGDSVPGRTAGGPDGAVRPPDGQSTTPGDRVLVAGEQVTVTEESWTGLTAFDAALRDRLAGLLGGVPVLPTGAGHDAGILAVAGVPAAMLFVRNPTGISHSPDEFAERADCLAGVEALSSVLMTWG